MKPLVFFLNIRLQWRTQEGYKEGNAWFCSLLTKFCLIVTMSELACRISARQCVLTEHAPALFYASYLLNYLLFFSKIKDSHIIRHWFHDLIWISLNDFLFVVKNLWSSSTNIWLEHNWTHFLSEIANIFINIQGVLWSLVSAVLW